MPDKDIPADAPPSYSDATGAAPSSSRLTRSNTGNTDNEGHLKVPGSSKSHSIPPEHRRSMEDERRPLPDGWVRSFDPATHHQFFVDTTKEPPRSIWVHPYDDEEYLSTLTSEQREHIEQESLGRGHPPSKADMIADHTDVSEDDHHESGEHELPPRPVDKGKKPLGRKLKDKLTGTTHEQRVRERQRRDEEERRMYEQHLAFRRAMAQAAETGQPQFVGKDPDGKDVYVEPPAYSGGYGYRGGYGYNPYGMGGSYTTPNARYIRPAAPYGRPYGGGFGGGYGLPLALGGGLMGGMLLGGALGGF